MIRYVNVPPLIGVVVSAKLASLMELQTIYGVEDCYNLAEIVMVDIHNHNVINEAPP